VNAVLQQIESSEEHDPSTRGFSRSRLKRLLGNPVYMGQLVSDRKLYAGEHEAIVDATVWRKVNELLKQEAVSRARASRPAGQPRCEPCTSGRTPRIARLLALAWRLEGMWRAGVVSGYKALAEVGHVSRSRLTQIVNLVYLAPDIQEQILFLDAGSASGIYESSLRKLCCVPDWSQQRQRWRELTAKPPVPK
jgi:hypothetical protein